MVDINRRFADDVAAFLTEHNYEFQVEPSIRGLTPDFVVQLDDHRSIIVETKGWEPTKVNLDRAANQAGFFRSELGAMDSVVVLPSVPTDARLGDGVVGLPGLETWLRNATKQPQVTISTTLSDDIDSDSDKPRPIMFCAMPFSGEYDDVFFFAMRTAADRNGMTARRVDQESFADGVLDQIHKLIRRSAMVVADVSESHPNVLYEAGFARGLGRKVQTICSTPLKKLPFNIAHNNTLVYKKGQTHQLQDTLSERVQGLLTL